MVGMIPGSSLLQSTGRLGSGAAESGVDALRSEFIPVCRLLNNHKMRINRFTCSP